MSDMSALCLAYGAQLAVVVSWFTVLKVRAHRAQKERKQ